MLFRRVHERMGTVSIHLQFDLKNCILQTYTETVHALRWIRLG